MKIKLGCLFILMLIGILAIGTVSASENITQDNDDQVISTHENSILTQNSVKIESINDNSVLTQNNDNKIESGENNILSGPSNSDKVDLHIYGWFREYNYGNNVELTIEVANFEGTSLNTKVNIDFNDGLKIIDYKPSKGTYNKKTGVWTIGNLDEYTLVELKIQFDILKYKTYIANFKVTTDSNDSDQSNNHGLADITAYEPKKSNTTTGTYERHHNVHRGHYLSSGSGLISRSVTKSANLTEQKATSVEKPAGNPILLLLFSIALMGLPIRKN